MGAVHAVNVVSYGLLVLGAVFIVLGLVPPTRSQLPWSFGTGVTMVVLGFAMLVVLVILGVS